jgi:hypothetical protein
MTGLSRLSPLCRVSAGVLPGLPAAFAARLMAVADLLKLAGVVILGMFAVPMDATLVDVGLNICCRIGRAQVRSSE